MDKLEEALSILDDSLSTNRKRHIVGGILVSVSLLFGGLAITVMSLKMEERKNDEHIE